MLNETIKKMLKFSLFKKSNKFYWSPETVIYGIVFMCLGVIFFKQNFLELKENFIDEFFIWVIISTLAFGLIIKFYNLNKYEPLRGHFEGYLSFEEKSITIGNEVYSIDEIRTIKISNDDYLGKQKNISSGNFGPVLSNGTENFITIFFSSGKSKRYQFELINSDDFQKLREILIDYHIAGKIDYWELAQVLGEKNTSETLELTKEIEKRSTTTNSR